MIFEFESHLMTWHEQMHWFDDYTGRDVWLHLWHDGVYDYADASLTHLPTDAQYTRAVAAFIRSYKEENCDDL